MKLFNTLSIVSSAIVGALSYYLGGFDILLQSLIALVIIDYLTGLLKGIYTKKLSSEIGYKGIIKKVFIFLVVATSFIIETVIGIDTPIREITIFFFIANEGISVLENSSIFIPVPDKLKAILVQLRGE